MVYFSKTATFFKSNSFRQVFAVTLDCTKNQGENPTNVACGNLIFKCTTNCYVHHSFFSMHRE